MCAQLRDKDMALVDTATELSTMEMELQVLIPTCSLFRFFIILKNLSFLIEHVLLQALVDVAQEISRQGIKPGTRKINGRYIHSHLASRLEGEHPALSLVSCLHMRNASFKLLKRIFLNYALYHCLV